MAGDSKKPRYLVGIFASPYAEALIRLTERRAKESGGSWLGVYVDSGASYRDDEKALLAHNTELVRALGGEVISIQSVDLVDGLLLVAGQNGVTQIVIGKSQRGRLHHLLRGGSVVSRLLKKSGSIDVFVVASEYLPRKSAPISPRTEPAPAREWRALPHALLVIAVFWALAAALNPLIGYQAVGLVFLMAVVAGGMLFSRGTVFAIAVLASLIHNFFFIPPRHTFAIRQPQDVLIHLMFFLTASSIGHLTTRLRRQNRIIESREDRAVELYHLARAISAARNKEEVLQAGREALTRRFRAEVKTRLHQPLSEPPAPKPGALTLPLQGKETALGEVTLELPRGRALDYFEREFAQALVDQLAAGLEREALYESRKRVAVLEQTEKLYRALFDSVSHELKSPLTTLKGAASLLTSGSGTADLDELAQQMAEETERLLYIVDNLLNMSRIESGAWQPHLRVYDIADLLGPALRELENRAPRREIRIAIVDGTHPVRCDGPLVVQALGNILHNAVKYSPPASAIEIDAADQGGFVVIRIRDHGPGLPEPDPAIVFDKFYRERPEQSGGLGLGLAIAKGFIDGQGGILQASNHEGGGAVLTISLPAAV